MNIGDIVMWKINPALSQQLIDTLTGVVFSVEPGGSFCSVLFTDSAEPIDVASHRLKVVCAARQSPRSPLFFGEFGEHENI
jgi:hypothetical protein